MKINYENYPVLEKIETGSLGAIGVAPEDAFEYLKYKELFDSAWSESKSVFGKNIQLVSSSFNEAIAKSVNKTLDEELIRNLHRKERGGCLLMGQASLCYYIRPMPDGGFVQIYFEFRNTTSGAVVIDAFTYLTLDKNYKGTAAVFFPPSRSKNKSSKELLQLKNEILTATLNFIEYADVETKHLGANEKIWDGPNCKYNNRTLCNVKILDSTWFTNLVKSDAFKVRGHFRLQPYGEGMSKKKLIWINDFEKHGYTRKAGILKDQE